MVVCVCFPGYSDCVDVNVFDHPVENIDGFDANKWIWNQVDHCQYYAPKAITTRCTAMAAADGPDKCVAALTGRRKEMQCDTACNTRYGVVVVPFVNPSTTAFPERVNIPWGDPACANSDWTLLTDGFVSRNAVDWTRWTAKTLAAGKACGGGERRMTLRQAVLECTRADCAGISVQHAATSDAELQAWAESQSARPEHPQHLEPASLDGGLQRDRLVDRDAAALPVFRWCASGESPKPRSGWTTILKTVQARGDLSCEGLGWP